MKRLISAVKKSLGGDRGTGGAIVADGVAGFSILMDAISTAQILARTPDEETGARTFVISRTLRGSFLYCREEAERRIRIEFPGLSDGNVRKGINALDSRVRMQSIPPSRERTNWVNSWRY